MPNTNDINGRRRHVIYDHVRIDDDQLSGAINPSSAAFRKFSKAQCRRFYPFCHMAGGGRVEMTDVATNVNNIGDGRW